MILSPPLLILSLLFSSGTYLVTSARPLLHAIIVAPTSMLPDNIRRRVRRITGHNPMLDIMHEVASLVHLTLPFVQSYLLRYMSKRSARVLFFVVSVTCVVATWMWMRLCWRSFWSFAGFVMRFCCVF